MMSAFIKFPCGKQLCFSNDEYPTALCLRNSIHWLKTIDDEDYYLVCSGRRIVDPEPVKPGATYHVVPRLLGGKGGFGSMLRAIGAQIEKTTSREACRDLSGRRMRDVNNEKKLREWVSKKADREREREERRQQRVERRRAEPRHKFDDPTYEEQKRTVIDNLDDALQEGLKSAGVSEESRKRKSEQSGASPSKKARDWLGDGLSDSDLGSDISDSEGAAAASESSSSGTPTPGPSASELCEDESSPGSSNPATSDSAVTSKERLDTDTGGEVEVPESSTNSDHCKGSECPPSEVQPEATAVCTMNTEDAATESSETPVEKPKGPVEIDLSLYSGAEELEALGMEALKAALMARGLKCGGSLTERAARLCSVKGLSHDEIKPSLFAKGGKVKGRK